MHRPRARRSLKNVREVLPKIRPKEILYDNGSGFTF